MLGFDIYFNGEILAGKNPAEVKTRVAEVFGLSDDELDNLFTGKPQRIKTNIKAEEAGKYRQAFLNAGALVTILPTGSEPPSASPAVPPKADPQAESIQLLPANTGSLIDTAKPAPEFKLSSADHLSLLPADTPSQEPSVEPVFDWGNISDVEVLPANTGSLEDCAEKKKASPVPDISSIKLVE